MRVQKKTVDVVCVILCFFGVIGNAAAAPVLPLEGRLEVTPGSGDFQAYYDPNLDVTWLADANLASTNHFGVSGSINSNGVMSWDTAISWISGMNAANYFGYSDWRLPSFDANNDGVVSINGGYCFYSGPGSYCTDNEMNFLYWKQLINSNQYNNSTVTNPFSNIVSTFPLYWSNIDNGLSSRVYSFSTGQSTSVPKSFITGKVWAVRTGDVGLTTVVPVAPALWLFLSGGAGLLAVARRGRR